MNKKGFTLIEILVAIGLVATIAGVVYFVINPAELIKESRYKRTKSELAQIAKAIERKALEDGEYPADTPRGSMVGIEDYISNKSDWPNGPYPGSVYDYDNWSDSSCIDPEADGTIQITLRNVPGYNPDGSDTWALYYVIVGKGTPHCGNADEWDKGECMNCDEE